MKNKFILLFILLVIILIVASLFTGCGKQIEIKSDLTQTGGNSLLEQIDEFQFVPEDNRMNLELSSIELKINNTLKGKVALVYTQKPSESAIGEYVKNSYFQNEKKYFEKDLSLTIQEIVHEMETVQPVLKNYLNQEQLKDYQTIVKQYQDFNNELNAGTTLSMDDMLDKLSESRSLIEQFVKENISGQINDLQNEVSKALWQYEMLEILKDAYDQANNSFDDYKADQNYSGLYNKVVEQFNAALLQHVNVANHYQELMDWANELIIGMSTGSYKRLPFFLDSLEPTETEEKVKSGDSEYAVYMVAETYKELSEITGTAYELKRQALTESRGQLDELIESRRVLNNILNVDFQNQINKLKAIKDKLIKAEIDESIEATEEQLVEELNTIMILEGSSIKFTKVDHDSQEIFAVYSVKELVDLLPVIYLVSVEGIHSDSDIKGTVIRDFMTIQIKYVADCLKLKELKQNVDLISEIEYQTESLKVITIGLEASAIKKNYYKAAEKVRKEYENAAQRLIQEYITKIDAIGYKDILEQEEELITEFTKAMEALNTSFAPVFTEEVDRFKSALLEYDAAGKERRKGYVGVNEKDKAYSDEEGIKVVLGLVKGYYEKLEKEPKVSLKEIQDSLNENIFGFMLFEKPLNIKITVEGKFLVKLDDSGNVDQKDNFQINAIPSGDKSIKVLPNSESVAFMMKFASVGNYQLIFIFLILLGLYGVLFIFKRVWFKRAVTLFFLVLIAAIIIYPIVWIIGASFNKGQSLLSVGINPIPQDPSLLQFIRLFKTTDYLLWYLNTFKIATLNMIFSVLITVFAAYVLSRFRFKGKKTGLMVILVLQCFPSFLGMVAIYVLLSRITMFSSLTGTNSLIDTHLGLLLVYISGQIPFNTWLAKGYFDTIPISLDEAARIDGASYIQTFWRIILPLGRPIIAFIAVVNFMAPWMDFIFPTMILRSPEKITLAVGLYNLINTQSANRFTMFAAGAVLVAVPIIALYSYFQKYIITGLSSGAVKE